MSILQSCSYHCRVSSVLNKDVKSYGKKHLFDGNEDTCWNSDQGSPQWIYFEFSECVQVTAFSFQFQGGFVGMSCTLEIKEESNSIAYTEDFYPEDVNSLQMFTLKEPKTAKYLKFVFYKSTDFFGRIVLYKLDIMGNKRYGESHVVAPSDFYIGFGEFPSIQLQLLQANFGCVP